MFALVVELCGILRAFRCVLRLLIMGLLLIDYLLRFMNAEKFNLNKIYFGGFFIRGELYSVSVSKKDMMSKTDADLRYHIGHAATIATLSYAIRFWSKGTKRALFLRHEGFL